MPGFNKYFVYFSLVLKQHLIRVLFFQERISCNCNGNLLLGPTKVSFNFSRDESPAPLAKRFLLGSRCTLVFPLSSPASSFSPRASCFLFYMFPIASA